MADEVTPPPPEAGLREAAARFHAAYCPNCPDNPCSLGIALLERPSVSSISKDDELDCAEGCSGDHKHKWEIEPHPYNKGDFDVFVTDSDDAARSAVLAAAEMEWDICGPGEERAIKIRHNKVLP